MFDVSTGCLAFSAQIQTTIDHDPIQPGGKLRLASEAGQPLWQPNADILRNILSIFEVTAASTRYTQDQVVVPLQQLLKCRTIPICGTACQLCICLLYTSDAADE